MDDCNNCTCGFGGDVVCTERDCGGSGSSCTYRGNRYNNGAVFKDDCQTCLCLFGTVSCSGKKCQAPSCACITLWDPVCGVDGKTYGNSCELRCAGVPLKHKGECRPYNGPCFARLEEWKAATANGHVGWMRPRCAANGDFLGMQYGGSQAYCVAPDGTEIPGSAVDRWEAVDMYCQCARDRYAYQQSGGELGRRFYCDRFGNYEPIGCTGSVCYCQDCGGNQIREAVDIGDVDSLNCKSPEFSERG